MAWILYKTFSLNILRPKHDAKLLISVKVFPVNRIDEAINKLPAGVLVTGCEFNKQS